MSQQTAEQATYVSQDLIDTMPSALHYPNAIRVYAVLALGRSEMNVVKIAGQTGISEKATRRAISHLQNWNVADWMIYPFTARLRSAYQADVDAVFASASAGRNNG